jgi:hypothetical protein
MTHEGGCLCRQVRWKAQGEPINVRYCHCRQCQLAMGAPYFARALFAQDAVSVEGNVEQYPSSDRLWRVFCRECGTRLFARRTDGSVMGIALATFDDPEAYAPTEHVFVSEKIAWLPLCDDLPQFDQRPPE